MLAFVSTLAGIGWEPTIRGWLTVALGSAVLMGSVWLLLVTNLGHRLGSLVAFAAFFGWMAIMGLIWWMYGIGYRGDPPEWVVVEFVADDAALAASETGPVDQLAAATIGESAPDLVDRYCGPLLPAYAEVLERRVDDPTTAFAPPAGLPDFCTEAVAESVVVDAAGIRAARVAANDALPDGDARKLSAEEFEEDLQADIDDEQRKISQFTLSALAAVAPDLVDQARDDGILDFEGWKLLSTAEAGEAQAAADAWLVENSDASGFGSSGEFLVLNTFQRGGKFVRTDPAVLARVWAEIRNSATIFHPTNYAVVEVQRALQKQPIPGQAPPFAELDDEYPRQYVVMVRDLGDLRVPPAIVTLASLAIFVGLCLMMSRRDALVRERVGETT